MAACTARDGGAVLLSLHPAASGRAGSPAPGTRAAAGISRRKGRHRRATHWFLPPGLAWKSESSFRKQKNESLSLAPGSAGDWARSQLSRDARSALGATVSAPRLLSLPALRRAVSQRRARNALCEVKVRNAP